MKTRRLILSSLLGVALFVVLVGFSSCGGIEAAREAGERAGGGGSEEKGEPSGGDPGSGEPTIGVVEGTSGGSSGEEAAQANGGTGTSEPVLDEKWYVDSDGNYVPDFVEAENDRDPKRDDCAPERCGVAGEGIDFLTKERNALLILDSSGSMSAEDGGGAGRTKMEAAKESLLRYSGVSAAVFETGFMVFGHEGDSTRAGKAESCGEAAETLLPMGEVEPESFEGVLNRFRPTGWTPIEGALDEAGREFAGREDQVNRVVLVTDGIETCGGDPVAAAERLHGSGVELQIDVVGFGVPTDQAGQLEDIALAGGGEYFDAETGADLDRYFEEQSRAIEQTTDALRCEVDNATIKGGCDAILCTEGVNNLVAARTDASYAIPDAQADDDPELEAQLRAEIDAYDRLIDRIYEGLEERRLARENASARIDDLSRQLDELRDQRARAYGEAYGGG